MSTDLALDIRYEALARSVEHHGRANTAPNSVPANVHTVIETAEKFAAYLTDGTKPSRVKITNHK